MILGIVYCETLESEIREVARRFPEIRFLEKMPWGLHMDPERLLDQIRRKILDLQDRVDAIVLGYGRCQTLDRLGEGFPVPVVRPEGEDCIGVLLGQRRYEEELRREAGTWFLSPGWTRMGIRSVFGQLQTRGFGSREADPLRTACRMLEGYTRALQIRMRPGPDEEGLEEKARGIARDLGLRLEQTEGSLARLERAVRQALGQG
jgi:hypothetical protein